MGSEWTSVLFGEVSSFIKRGISPKYISSGGILVVNQKCIRDQTLSFENVRRTDSITKSVPKDRFLQKYDILINSTGVGTLGRVAQVLDLPEETTVDSHVTIIRPDATQIDPYYLGFVIRNNESLIEC